MFYYHLFFTTLEFDFSQNSSQVSVWMRWENVHLSICEFWHAFKKLRDHAADAILLQHGGNFKTMYLLKRLWILLCGTTAKCFRLIKCSLFKEMWFQYLRKRYGPKMRGFDTSGLSGTSDVRDRGPNVLGLPQLSLLCLEISLNQWLY